MKNKTEETKKHIADYTFIFCVFILLTLIFCIYFYNVFLKFQIEYETIYNEKILSKASELNNDIIRVSNSLFLNGSINKYLYTDMDYDLISAETVNSHVSSSSLGSLVDEFLIAIPGKNTAYFSALNDKADFSYYEKNEPELYKIFTQKSSGITTNEITRENTKYITYSYNDFRGHIICMLIPKDSLNKHFFTEVYPLAYGNILLGSDGKIITQTGTENIKLDISSLIETKNDFVKYKKNFLIQKRMSKSHESISLIKLSDIMQSALKTSSFLVIFALLLFALVATITYYFYFKQKGLILSHKLLEASHKTEQINNTVQKIFMHDSLNKNDKNILLEYFSPQKNLYFLPITICITDFNEIVSLNGYDDITLVKYGFENIINEVFSESQNVKTVNMGNELIGILIYSDKPADAQYIKSKLKFISDFIYKNFDIHIFCAAGNTKNDILSVYNQIPSLINALNYRLILNSNIVILSEFENETSDAEYPTELQTKIIHSLMTKDNSDFCESLDEFSNYIVKNRCLNGKRWFIKLFLAIWDKFEKEPNIMIDNNALEKMVSCDRISDIKDTLLNAVSRSDETEETEDMSDSFHETAKRLIEKNYSDPNFCIQSITDEIDLTAAYFGRKFKNEFSVSFNRYLLEYRLNHAIILLKETNLTNAKIAEMCGFNSEKYFLSIFKKNIGLSPKEYKKKL